MARFEAAEPVLKEAERWKDRCLRADGSVFADRQLWTRSNFDDLDRYFVQNLNAGEGDFFQKLEVQLQPARSEVKQLAAEMLWVLYLVVAPTSMKAETKLRQIKQVWEWSGDDLPLVEPSLDAVLAEGFLNPGTAFNTQRWRELLFFVLLMKAWKGLPSAEHERLLASPWAFVHWMDSMDESKGRQFRHALLFLLFPEHFEPIVVSSHKREIIQSFHSHWGEPIPQIDYQNRSELDRALLSVRERVDHEHPEHSLHFYAEPLDGAWRKPVQKQQETTDVSLAEVDEWFRRRIGKARVWAISPGEGARLWTEFQHEGIVAIGWDEIGDLSDYTSKDATNKAIVEAYDKENPVMDSLACWQFLKEMNVGDFLIVKRGRQELLGLGTVQSQYRHEQERDEYRNVRDATWVRSGHWTLPEDRTITVKTLTDFTGYREWVKFAFDLIEAGGKASGTGTGPRYGMKEAMKGVFMSQEDFRAMVDTLAQRRNVILEGPPGVGKTFVARRLAWTLIGHRTEQDVEMVQFHQSYSYEDFVQGWRPTEAGSFELKDGVFHRFCKRAVEAPDQQFVFIIDEINRGNLSKILGELMMLIEADKRGPDFAVSLTYASGDDERFYVPPNVYLIGLMNTADRSLAMVDYALRRRFSFIRLRPEFRSAAFSDYLAEREASTEMIERIVNRLTDLNQKITADRTSLGPGYEIGHSFFCPSPTQEPSEDWYEGVVRSDIEPLLREYWLDDPDRVKEAVADLLR